ncbi:MAG: alpha/beta hydrolase [Candidatus Nanopelagicales bacterium]
MRGLLILHGWTNVRPAGHWQRLLAAAARARGDCVLYPQFPDPDLPVLADWLDLLAAELHQLDEAGVTERVVVAHSLGCLTWLHACAQEIVPTSVDRVLLVAPAAPALLDEIPDFRLDPADPGVGSALRAASRSALLVGSDADPWTPAGLHATFGAPLGIPSVVIPGGGHLALSDGWGPWQGVIDWVADPSADLTVR